MARTRSKPAKSLPKASTPEPPPSTAKALPASTSHPPKLFVLPKNTSKDARIVTLNNPATGAPSRYFFCPQKGFHEFTRICAPKRDCRSWLVTGSPSAEVAKEQGTRIGSGYVTQNADLLIATPIDIVFLILPALQPQNAKDTRQHFLALDDYLDMLGTSSRHWKVLLVQHGSVLRGMIEKRIRSLCDSVDAGGESMYRPSNDKILSMLMRKAERMVTNGLPKSLEEKFVKSALEVPVMNIRREDSTLSAVSNNVADGAEGEESQEQKQEETPEQEQKQNQKDTTETPSTDSQPTTSTPTIPIPQPALTTPPSIPPLLRTDLSLRYLCTSYLPPSLSTTLLSLASPTFIPLATHLSAITALKAEAMALRSISDNISRKRAFEEDEEKVAAREEKKRKKEEEEKKKKAEGRAIKQLKKVDTSGMKKMSSFFTKIAKKT